MINAVLGNRGAVEIRGMRPAQLASGAVGLAAGLTADVVTGTARWLGGRRHGKRDVWIRPGRWHIETHGVHGPGGARVARAVERELEGHPRVLWARVNAPACRVVVAVTDLPPRPWELIELLEKAETVPADEVEQVAEGELHHPSEDLGRTRLLPNLAVDAVSLAVAGITRLSPWTPVPSEVAGLVSAAGLHPWFRERAAQRLHGAERADSLYSMTSRITQALAAGGSGAVLDIASRVSQWREARAAQQAWQRAEPQLIQGPDDAGAAPAHRPRPVPLRDGPVERYQRRALGSAAAATVAAAPMVGPRRAAATGIAALPKSTQAGPDAFAAHLGRVISRRGGLVMDRAALRRLGALDTLVLDAAVLRAERHTLTDLVPLPDADPAQVAERGFALFDPADPDGVRRDGDWSLGPVDALEVRGRTGAREQRALTGSGQILGLARRHRLLAVLAAEPEPVPGLDALIAAARQARVRVVLAGDELPGPDGFADQHVPAADLTGFVRQRQRAGEGVMVVGTDRRALGAADCGIGVHSPGTPPPWGAHLIVEANLSIAVLLVEAISVARRVERDAITLAQLTSGVGVVSALAGRAPRPASRSLGAVNAGATLAFVDGSWRAHTLHTNGVAPPRARPPWHLMPSSAAIRELGSDTQRGLTAEQASQRAGAGEQVAPLGTSLGAAFLEELANPLTPVLAGGAAVSAVLGSIVDAGLVAGITAASALTGAVQRVRTDRALADLLATTAVSAVVRRDGVEQNTTADRLVPGDVIRLRAGDVVPADCRLLEATGVEVDESSLTGESLPAAKDPAPVVAAELADRSSMVYEGTTLASGEALALVVATGADTEVGRSMATARRAAPRGGVQAHLAKLTRRSLPLALGSVGAVTVAGLLHRVPIRESLHTAVNLAISSVPEGLPFLINAAQLSAARRLADQGALVRNPNTIEALGRVDVLCFDKTGTLTEGKLAVSLVHDGRTGQDMSELDTAGREVLAAALRATPEGRRPEDLAHQTDRAVVHSARRAKVNTGTGARGWRQRISLPFDPSRSLHATYGRAGKNTMVSVKGAPEVVLSHCRHRRVDGKDQPLDGDARAELATAADQLAGEGYRVLAVAERREPEPEPEQAPLTGDDPDVPELVFLGYLALADPVRSSAAPAAARLRDSGVRIVMVTGDHPATAEAIAATVHPDRTDLDVVTGADLDQLSDDELDTRLPSVDVIARCSPSQKVRIIQAYQRLDKVVAMTGDGANDAPAIRLADVGVALGRRGTPAAQAAADLVVSDDRLETIIAALVEGRAMWSSVRHALGILLGGNLGEIAFTVMGATLTGRSPLGARQLLLVNLLTDLAPAVAIALRPPNGEDIAQLLREGPDRSLGGALNQETTVRAIATATGAGGAWLAARLTGRHRRAATVALAALVGAQLGQTLLTGGLDRNVLLASFGSAAVLAGVIQTPGVSGFFGCTPLGPVGWSLAAGGATAGSLLGAGLLQLRSAIPEPAS